MGVKRPASALWLAHKPAGVTSASLVEDFRREHAGNFTLKVAHGGVLDPFADGLVILLVGAANRVFELLHEVPKAYTATIAWGAETDTGDSGGRIIAADQTPPPPVERVDAALRESFLGWTEQVPPLTSNKRVGGERAYAKAHRGEHFELPAVRVYLHSAKLEGTTLSLECRGGFYVRSFVRDLARKLGTRAHLTALTRTAIGPWSDPPAGERVLVKGRDALPWLPARELTDAEWGTLRATGELETAGAVAPPGWKLPDGFPPPSPLVRAFHQGRLVALLEGARVKLLLPGGL